MTIDTLTLALELTTLASWPFRSSRVGWRRPFCLYWWHRRLRRVASEAPRALVPGSDLWAADRFAPVLVEAGWTAGAAVTVAAQYPDPVDGFLCRAIRAAAVAPIIAFFQLFLRVFPARTPGSVAATSLRVCRHRQTFDTVKTRA